VVVAPRPIASCAASLTRPHLRASRGPTRRPGSCGNRSANATRGSRTGANPNRWRAGSPTAQQANQALRSHSERLICLQTPDWLPIVPTWALTFRNPRVLRTKDAGPPTRSHAAVQLTTRSRTATLWNCTP